MTPEGNFCQIKATSVGNIKLKVNFAPYLGASIFAYCTYEVIVKDRYLIVKPIFNLIDADNQCYVNVLSNVNWFIK